MMSKGADAEEDDDGVEEGGLGDRESQLCVSARTKPIT